MKNAAATNCSWKKELNLFLGAYRAKPHSSTGVAPSQLIFKFNSTSRLISLVKSGRVDRSSDDSKAIGNDNIAKARMKEHGDKHLKVHEAGLQVGDMVLFQPPKQRISSKLKPAREINIFRVDIVKGSNVTATSTTTNRTINRNSSCFRRTNIDLKLDSGLENSFEVDFGSLAQPEMETIQRSGYLIQTGNDPTSIPTEVVRRQLPNRENRGKISKSQVDPSKKAYS
jgi:hypothetical protein